MKFSKINSLLVAMVIYCIIGTSSVFAWNSYSIDGGKGWFKYGQSHLLLTHFRQESEVYHKSKYHRASVIARYCGNNYDTLHREYANAGKTAWTASKYATCMNVYNSYYWYQ